MPFNFLLQATSQVVKIGGIKISLWWWPFVFAFFKNMFIFMDILIIFAIILLIYRFQSFRVRIYEAVEEAIESGKLSKGRIQRKWDDIKELMESDNLEDRKKAVIEAEAMLDDALKSANIPGENLEKRLSRFSDADINFKDDIIWAHRLEERMKTGEDYEMDEEEIGRAFYVFERTMKELNIL